MVGVLVLMIVPMWSYIHALTAPGNAPLSARTLEWISNHGGRPLVVWAEGVWLNHHKPPVGGDPSGGIPNEAAGSTRPNGSGGSTNDPKMVPDHLAKPPDVAPIVPHPLPNEGVWQPLGRKIDGIPSMYASFFRPDKVHTSLVAGVVWMDPKLLSARLVPGVQDPGGSGWSWLGEVPPSARASLVAAFNSGFYLRESQGGFYADGKTASPLLNGSASLVIYRNGTANVGQWGRDMSMNSNVVSVRQNLRLIVDGGRPVAGLTSDTSNTWGATYGNTVLAWRSAVGVTSDGALVFGASDGLSVVTLADIMVRAGAVRAMELDINHLWVSFETYKVDPTSTYGAVSTPLLPGMWYHPERYLKIDERDFFAMFARPLASLKMVPASAAPSP